MKRAHGMFIPERAYLVDLEGLVNYLYDKIHALHECLYCGQVRYTATGTQTHMRDKGHCMIAFESEAEMLDVGEFYDFRATYSDDEEDDEEEEGGAAVPKDGPRLGGKREAAYTAEDGDENMEDGEGWESDAEDEDMSDRETVGSTARPSKRSNPRTQPAYRDEYELHLPSGRTAGHRSLARYYRQNLANYPTPEERADQRLIEGRPTSDDEGTGALTHRQRGRDRENQITRANGGTGMLGVSEFKKKEVQRLEVHEKKREERARANYQWAKDKKGNNQKHFRVSCLPSLAFSDIPADGSHRILFFSDFVVC